MSWLQLIIESDKEHANQIVDYLELFGVQSVSLTASSTESIISEGINNNSLIWDRTRVTALIHPDTDLDILFVCLRDRIGVDYIFQHSIELLEDRDWESAYKENFQPNVYDEHFCICPSWHTPPEHIKHVLNLDPGLAFGTGSHATTSLCLEWLVHQDLDNRTVTDFGCGSGILALSALKLGAKKAYAVDIDPQALLATRNNSKNNGFTDEQIIITSPDDLKLPATEILVANVLFNPLKDLASQFADMVCKNGTVILSGILAHQAEECLDCYQSWFNMAEPVYRQEWVLLEGKRK